MEKGKLLGIKIGDKAIECQPESLIQVESTPMPWGEIVAPNIGDHNFTVGEKVTNIVYNGKNVGNGVVHMVTDKEVTIHLYY